MHILIYGQIHTCTGASPVCQSIELPAGSGNRNITPPVIGATLLKVSLSPSLSEQLCAFCYCGGRSLLGQGDLQVFDSSPGHERNATGGGGQANDHSKASKGYGRDDSGVDRTTQPSDAASRLWDELAHVGLPGDVDVQSFFEESGQCLAHHCCALWSQGVCEGEGQSLLNVDIAIDSGSTEHCAYCKRLGASIKCCAEGCARLYHYPCAGAAGTFQDIRSLSLLCSDHIELAISRFPDDSICALCDSPGELPDQLFCTSCGQHYHGSCLDMAVTPLRRAGWQCPECKVCQTCKNPGEDDKMLVCDMCDKGYHTFCLQPAIDDIPTNGWRCQNCRVCIQCGTRTSGQWHHTSLLCDSCVQHQDPALTCPLCACILDPEHQKDLLSCHSCKRWLHLECERQSSGQADIQPSQGYVCSSCRPTGSPPQQAPLQAEEEAEEMDTGGLELSPQAAIQMHTESKPVVPTHTDLEPGAKQLWSPSPMHNDPETQLQPTAAKEAWREKQMSGILTDGVSTVAGASEEMDTTPETESKPNLSHLSPPINDKPYKTSMERLAEMAASPTHSSPRNRGPSPRQPSQPHHPHPTMGENGSSFSSTTLIPLTPKIGMGKPAISKRKFSPGRPRVKQGRGSGFPGRRRPRGAGLSGRGGRGRARGKNGASPTVNPGVTSMESPYQVKEEEENAMHNTVVIFSSNDSFTLKQDMCVVCGSFGLGAEGRLLACAQCGQCYHPFCVGIKITKVLLNKGWRCLECTVCEACGQATDPGRLLLCDDCDISYHTYCLDPPLQNVPKDSWKCKWCVSCTQCGATSPGRRCEWQNNYTQCAPCASLATCPFCLQDYSEGEIVVQCRQCDRWIHGSCQGLHSEEDVEKAADSSFDCTMCRVHKSSKVSKARDSIEPAVMTQVVTKAKEMDLARTYTQDGVCLTESGRCQLQSLSAPASRRRKPKPKLKLKIINQNSVAVLQAPMDLLSEHSRDEDMEDHRETDLSLDCDGKSDSSPEREPAEDKSKGADDSKKRKRKPYRPGIGGFMVRQRSRPGQGPGKAKRSLSRKDSSGSVSEPPTGKEEGQIQIILGILPGNNLKMDHWRWRPRLCAFLK
uniref:[Histone H3]-lysine(4) N-trimethyltransferase n=1 Tax=Oncorhynchus tshawytscha TaxID=74940 RepID=A0A8C8JDE8_ONCTS